MAEENPSQQLSEKEKALSEDFRVAFSGISGERVLEHLVEWSGVLHTSFVPGDHDSTIFNEGIKNTVRYILSRCGRLNLKDCEVLCRTNRMGQ